MPDVLDLDTAILGRLLRYNPGGRILWSYWPDQMSVSMLDVKYDPYVPQASETLVDSFAYSNDSDDTQTEDKEGGRTTTASFIFNLVSGIKTSRKGQADPSYVINPPPSDIPQPPSLSTSLTEAQPIRADLPQNWHWDLTIPVPPRSRVEVKIFISKILIGTNAVVTIELAGLAGIIWAGNIDGKPVKVRYFRKPIGEVFTTYPHPLIQVVDTNRVIFNARADVRLDGGSNYIVRTEQFPI